MKKVMLVVAATAVLCFAAKAFAGFEVINEDGDKNYEIVVKCGSHETGDSLYGSQKLLKSYPGDNCKLMLKGAEGGPKVEDGATYIIKNGSLYQK